MHFRLGISIRACAIAFAVVAAASVARADSEGPTIDVWYGPQQTFGAPGLAQQWVNVLGNVSDPDGVSSLSYSLNGAPARPINRGPDTRRLLKQGDFNIDIDFADLVAGSNGLVITAQDTLFNTSVTEISLNYSAATIWPLPFAADLSGANGVQEIAQVIDGEWLIESNGLRCPVMGYDRVLAIGDLGWTDYEVRATITMLDLDPNGYQWPSVSPGFGITLRWPGHSDDPVVCSQPRCGWLPSGAGVWYDTGANGPLRLSSALGFSMQQARTLDFDVPYVFKIRAQNAPGQGTFYAVKVWPAASPEPGQWDLSGYELPGGVAAGSAIFIGHHVDIVIEDVSVVPLGVETPPTITDVQVTPGESEATITWNTDEVTSGVVSYGPTVAYEDGDVASPANGTSHAVALTGLSAGQTYHFRITAVDLDSNATATADDTFATSADTVPPVISNLQITPLGVYSLFTWTTDEPATSRVEYGIDESYGAVSSNGALVTSHSVTVFGLNEGTLYHCRVSSADDNGNSQSTPDQTFTTLPPATGGLVSDQFNQPALNTDLWTFINPLADATLSMNGAQMCINIPANGLAHEMWIAANTAPRILQAAANADFEMVVKFDSALTQAVQIQGIAIEQDALNLVRAEFHYIGGQRRIFVATIFGGSAIARVNQPVTMTSPMYLRVTRTGLNFIVARSADGNNWTAVASFNQPMTVRAVGIQAGATGAGHELCADFFFNPNEPPFADCNANGVDDVLDIAAGTSADCDNSGSPDECELSGNDCNSNGAPDDCDLLGNDCNSNGLPDECDADCNTNGIPDNCESFVDCNSNSLPDECELMDNDCNGDGVPDDCQLAANDCNANAIPDDCELLADCNSNGVPDECEIGSDCNSNGVPDDCELDGNDCNANGVPDECDLEGGDCNANGVPDDCELDGNDCNSNGVPDECDLANDCNTNGVPDECELDSNDCNVNSVPDECELSGNDCNNSGIPDECELSGNDCNSNGAPDECDGDCNTNGIPDNCESFVDCNSNSLPDECELMENDCNGDGVPDDCQLFGNDCNTNGTPDDCEDLADCNSNGVADECELAGNDCNGNGILDACEVLADCNSNAVPDACDISAGTSDDVDGDLVPDECQVRNLTRGTAHASISDAIAQAFSGDSLLANDRHFAESPTIDFAGKGLLLTSTRAIHQPAGGTITLAGDAELSSAIGDDVQFAGALTCGPADRIDVLGDRIELTTSGSLVLPVSAMGVFTAPFGATLDGAVQIQPQALLACSDSATIGGSASLFGGTISASELVVAGPAASLTFFGSIMGNVTNQADVVVVADAQIVGDYLNNGATIIQNGTLTLIGSLTGGGTIIGDNLAGRAGDRGTSARELFVSGNFSVDEGASLMLATDDWSLRVGGDFDVGIRSAADFDMSQAELRMVGLGPLEQHLEAMSADTGPQLSGLTPGVPGQYPIGFLRIGPTPTTVYVVNDVINVGETSGVEAIYVDTLLVAAGATLITDGHLIYYRNLVLDGSVDEPANLIRLVGQPGDCDLDGDVDSEDAAGLPVCLGGPGAMPPQVSPLGCDCPATFDFDGDGDVDLFDYAELQLQLP